MNKTNKKGTTGGNKTFTKTSVNTKVRSLSTATKQILLTKETSSNSTSISRKNRIYLRLKIFFFKR